MLVMPRVVLVACAVHSVAAAVVRQAATTQAPVEYAAGCGAGQTFGYLEGPVRAGLLGIGMGSNALRRSLCVGRTTHLAG